MALKRKYPRHSYAKGWGRASVTDARLKGWEPLALAGPEGSVVEVLSVEERGLGSGHALEAGLYVLARVKTPDGNSWVLDDMLRRPTRASVWEMMELADYLEKVVGDRDLVELRDEMDRCGSDDTKLRWADGPPLRSVDFLQCLDAVERWRELLKGSGSEEISVSRAELEAALDMAFLAGRRVAAAEVPGQLQRTKALGAARRRSAALKAWWPDGANWAQKLVDAWSPADRLSLAALAGHMWEAWSTGPLASGVARRSVRQLETVILPAWRDGGLLKLPTGTGQP